MYKKESELQQLLLLTGQYVPVSTCLLFASVAYGYMKLGLPNIWYLK